MQFKVGDQVVHTSHGSGQIMAIEEKRSSGKEAALFYAVVTSNSTVWVPVDSAGASNLRLSASHGALAHCRTLLKSRPTPLHSDRRQRLLELTRRLRQGSFEILCEVVRDLTAHGWPKPLNAGDATTLRATRDAVCREWAAAADVSPLQASQEITTLLQEGHRMYNP